MASVGTRQNLNSQADHAADLLQRVAVVFRCLWKSLGRIFDQKMDILQGILATHNFVINHNFRDVHLNSVNNRVCPLMFGLNRGSFFLVTFLSRQQKQKGKDEIKK